MKLALGTADYAKVDLLKLLSDAFKAKLKICHDWNSFASSPLTWNGLIRRVSYWFTMTSWLFQHSGA